jgi:hypothetical protein
MAVAGAIDGVKAREFPCKGSCFPRSQSKQDELPMLPRLAQVMAAAFVFGLSFSGKGVIRSARRVAVDLAGR